LDYDIIATNSKTMDNVGANCKCGLPSVLRQVTKESANQGRYFYTCPKNKNQGPCDYFLWADGEDSKVQTRYNAKRQPTTPPQAQQQPQKKTRVLQRSNAVSDIRPVMAAMEEEKQQVCTPLSKGFDQQFDAKMIQLSTAQAQMLTKAIEENTMYLRCLDRSVQILAQTMCCANCAMKMDAHDSATNKQEAAIATTANEIKNV
jgi:hypothetical protein